MENTPEIKEWTIKKGSIVKINGLPYAVSEDTKITGFSEPDFSNLTLGEDHDSCEKSTQQVLDATAAKLQLLLAEARTLASLSSRLFAEIAPEKDSTKDLPEACEEHQSSPCATCCHFEKRY